MRLKDSKRLAAILLGLALLGGVLHLNLKSKESSQQTTLYSKNAFGLSIWQAWTERVSKDRITPLLKATLFQNDLGQHDALFLLSPKMPVSDREGAFIESFVNQGGLLVLSFHDRESLERLASIRSWFPFDVKDNSTFKNGVTHEIFNESGYASTWFAQGEKYVFYSPLWFDTLPCSGGDISCYVWFRNHGKGRVLVLSGLPPFGNALISKAHNRRMLYRLTAGFRRGAVDEYHHFFSEKTIWDLLRRPEFVVSVVGLLVLLILFFRFGYGKFHMLSQLRPVRPTALSLHDLNLEYFRSSLRSTQDFGPWLERHRLYLESRFRKKFQHRQLSKGVNRAEFLKQGFQWVKEFGQMRREKKI